MNTTDIHRFARSGNLAAINQASNAGVDINSKDTFGSTALHYAIAEKQSQAAKLLLELGADVTIQDADGKTALHYAIEHGLPTVLEALLKTCPRAVAIGDKHGNQPLWTAAFNARGNYEMVSMLLHCGADPNHLNRVNLSPLDVAKRTHDSTLLQLLDKWTRNGDPASCHSPPPS